MYFDDDRMPVKESSKDFIMDCAKAAGMAGLIEFAIVFTTSIFKKHF
ncbi:MAG TPA: hypothetical protein PK466_14725 [Thermotogota bacterium]|nr:hypothetical protein [Thermotogota bacterium]